MYNRSGIFFYYPISLFIQDKPFTLIDCKGSKKFISIKKKTIYLACKMCHVLGTCNENYIGESERQMAIRWKEYNNLAQDSEPTKHLYKNS